MRPTRARSGFTLIEAVIFVTVLSIVALGAAIGLGSVAHYPKANDDIGWTNSQIVSQLEQLHATPYASLNPASNPQTFTPTTPIADRNGTTYTITYTVTEIDPTKLPAIVTLTNGGIKQIVISLRGQSSTMWVTQ